MPFFRIFTHLLPHAEAWKITVEKTLRKFFVGLAAQPALIRTYIDRVWEDAFPETTRELATWENQFGIEAYGDDATRRAALAGEWAATGGQSPGYIQSVLHAAGFTNIFVHEWWSSLDPVTARDPHDYTNQPLIGTFQCTGYTDGPPFDAEDQLDNQPQCSPYGVDGAGNAYNQPQCNRFLANEPGYLVNKTLRNVAPPPVPDDENTWPYFLYFGAEEFGEAQLFASQRERFERLILKLSPAQQWLVTMIEYVADFDIFDVEFDDTFE